MSEGSFMDRQKREEITFWATQKAFDRAKELKIVDRLHTSDHFDAWIQSEIWHYEKMAYLKIYNREVGNKK